MLLENVFFMLPLVVRLAIAVNEHEGYSAGQNIYAFIQTIKRTIIAP